VCGRLALRWCLFLLVGCSTCTWILLAGIRHAQMIGLIVVTLHCTQRPRPPAAAVVCARKWGAGKYLWFGAGAAQDEELDVLWMLLYVFGAIYALREPQRKSAGSMRVWRHCSEVIIRVSMNDWLWCSEQRGNLGQGALNHWCAWRFCGNT
jgi:hypothetical protein